ncbi:MAG TPA: site-2 protease family protein [Chthonomonadales bacterium]|nr:site-2 protease family protein [Chthonomonadales bacterium]
MDIGFDLQGFIITMGVLILAITIHEFAHAITADRLGDPTPRNQGRISLFPIDHLDPIGTLMMAITSLTGIGIGWGKPVMTNPSNFRNPRRDSAIVAVAGPVSNILQAIVFALIFRALGGFESGNSIVELLQTGVFVNLSLAFFNLIPIAPLDGHWIMTAILPYQQAIAYRNWMLMYGPFVLLALVFLGRPVLSAILGPPVTTVASILMRGI